jgi:hypothetical protein
MARRKPETLIDRWVKLTKYRLMVDLGAGMTPDEAIEGLKLALAVSEELHRRLLLVLEAAEFQRTIGNDAIIYDPAADENQYPE